LTHFLCAQENEAYAEAFTALEAELEEAVRIWREKYLAATTDDERAALRKNDPYRVFEGRFLELARTSAGKSAAMQAVQWLADNGKPGAKVDEGLDLIEQHHFDDPDIAELCRALTHKLTPRVERFLQTVSANHPDRNVRGSALFCLARYLKNLDASVKALRSEPEWIERALNIYDEEAVTWMREVDRAELLARIDTICEQIVDEYGDVADEASQQTDGDVPTLADSAKILSFTVHAVGSIAPETSGQDADGSPISLAALRGNAVVFMFSANWCGPCKEVYGQLREQMRLYADKPFTVLTVMSDTDISTVKKAVESGEITWPVIWDGENGPIARRWGIDGYPTIYVIDGEGRIQSEGLRDEALDDQVASMLGISPESRVRVDKRTRVWRRSFTNQSLSDAELPELLKGYTELRELDLSDHPLSDESLVHLLPLTKLEKLNLQHTGISDKGLQVLKGLPNLKRLHLDLGPGHRTTNKGRRELQKALPDLRMSFITH
jgi:peroxiredoxin